MQNDKIFAKCKFKMAICKTAVPSQLSNNKKTLKNKDFMSQKKLARLFHIYGCKPVLSRALFGES